MGIIYRKVPTETRVPIAGFFNQSAVPFANQNIIDSYGQAGQNMMAFDNSLYRPKKRDYI